MTLSGSENGTLVEAKLPVPEKALVRYCPICTPQILAVSSDRAGTIDELPP
ncbi:Uncharacterised protein [Citrobacter freundii]|nr:Uncharacterised protein [Citrobacter freundii]